MCCNTHISYAIYLISSIFFHLKPFKKIIFFTLTGSTSSLHQPLFSIYIVESVFHPFPILSLNPDANGYHVKFINIILKIFLRLSLVIVKLTLQMELLYKAESIFFFYHNIIIYDTPIIQS